MSEMTIPWQEPRYAYQRLEMGSGTMNAPQQDKPTGPVVIGLGCLSQHRGMDDFCPKCCPVCGGGSCRVCRRVIGDAANRLTEIERVLNHGDDSEIRVLIASDQTVAGLVAIGSYWERRARQTKEGDGG